MFMALDNPRDVFFKAIFPLFLYECISVFNCKYKMYVQLSVCVRHYFLCPGATHLFAVVIFLQMSCGSAA